MEHRAPDDVGNLFATLGRTDREYGRAGEIRKRTTDAGVVTYAYDAEGNLQRRVDPDGGEWAYHFSDAGNLRQVDRPDGTAVVMARLGVSHSAVTGAQMTGYRAFAQTDLPTHMGFRGDDRDQRARSRWNGASNGRSNRHQAIDALKQAGVDGPTRIPWSR